MLRRRISGNPSKLHGGLTIDVFGPLQGTKSRGGVKDDGSLLAIRLKMVLRVRRGFS